MNVNDQPRQAVKKTQHFLGLFCYELTLVSHKNLLLKIVKSFNIFQSQYCVEKYMVCNEAKQV
jgi:hypothetical protein